MAMKSRRFSWRLCLASVTLVSGMVAGPAFSSSADKVDRAPVNLLAMWLAIPDATSIAWPYAYISAKQSSQIGKAEREDLLDEFSRLRWRLKDYGYPDLVQAVDAWRKRINSFDTFRVPGEWSPAFLLSHPNRRPPTRDIASIGVCDIPPSVGVWSASGFDDVPWHAGLKLSDVEKRIPATRQGSIAMVAVVDTYGHIDHYGVQSWNYANDDLAPGDQVVASLPLKGNAFEWIQDSLAELLARVPSGTNCRSIPSATESESD